MFKRGATFTSIYTANSLVVDGITVTDLTGWTARCQLRDVQGEIIEELTATIIDPVARKVRLASAGTTGWPKGKAQGDVWLIGPGGTPKVPGGTFEFEIGEGPTQWP
jgi:hypothetical protein